MWSQGFMAAAPDGFAGDGASAGSGDGGKVPMDKGAPPSSYAVAAVLEGERGSFVKLVGVTALRMAFIMPAVFTYQKIFGPPELTGIRQIGLAAFTSAGISVGLLGYYWIRKTTAPELPTLEGHR